ncbi:MAG: hypothetical protein F4Y88_03490 [Chloroflexi bacterium]|nr:hypothetical protein [Chloroflexota bacterium]
MQPQKLAKNDQKQERSDEQDAPEPLKEILVALALSVVIIALRFFLDWGVSDFYAFFDGFLGIFR